MAGANYMGGKRNAAKVRSKDATGRTQKVFFGRRRFEMLSKGLVGNLRAGAVAGTGSGTEHGERVDIELAHAKEKKELPPHNSSYIPSPTRPHPRTPKSRRSKQAIYQGSSSGTTQSSRVLDALDTTEPIFLRATMDKILAMSDLACLSACHTRTDLPNISPKGAESHGEKGQYCRANRSRLKKRRVSRDEDVMMVGTYGFGGASSETDANADNDIVYSDSGIDMDNNGFGTSTHVEEIMASPSDGISSPCRPSGSSPLSQYPREDTHFEPVLPARKLTFNKRSPEYRRIDVHPPQHQNASIKRQFPLFSSNNLFEHEDPWHTIGVILGLSPNVPRGITPSAKGNIRQTAASFSPMRAPTNLNAYLSNKDFRIPDYSASSPEIGNVSQFSVASSSHPRELSDDGFHARKTILDTKTLNSDPVHNVINYGNAKISPGVSASFALEMDSDIRSGSLISGWSEESELPLTKGDDLNSSPMGLYSVQHSPVLAPALSQQGSNSTNILTGDGDALSQYPGEHQMGQASEVIASAMTSPRKASSPTVPFPLLQNRLVTSLKNVDGVYQGPCLFPEDLEDDSDE